MAKIKEISRIAKLEFLAGKAKPGPELAGLGIVMPEFTKQFNNDTKDRGEEPVPVTITVYYDKSFSFKTHTAPAAYKIKQAAKIEVGSSNSKTSKIGTITKKQLQEIAEYKMIDMNTDSVQAAMNTIAGTAKNMGVLIEGIDNVAEEQAKAEVAKKAEIAANAKEEAIAKLEQDAIDNKDKVIESETIVQKKSEEDDK